MPTPSAAQASDTPSISVSEDISTLRAAREVHNLSTQLIHVLYPAYLADAKPAAEWITCLKTVRAKVIQYWLVHDGRVQPSRRSQSIKRAPIMWDDIASKGTSLCALLTQHSVPGWNISREENDTLCHMSKTIKDSMSNLHIDWYLAQEIEEQIDRDCHLNDPATVAKLYTRAEVYVLTEYIKHSMKLIIDKSNITQNWERDLTDLQTDCLLQFNDSACPISGLDRAMLQQTATRGATNVYTAESADQLETVDGSGFTEDDTWMETRKAIKMIQDRLTMTGHFTDGQSVKNYTDVLRQIGSHLNSPKTYITPSLIDANRPSLSDIMGTLGVYTIELLTELREVYREYTV